LKRRMPGYLIWSKEMHDSKDVTSLMIWLHELGDMGDVYPLSDGTFIWKRAGRGKDLFLCEKLDIRTIKILTMS